MGPTVAFILLTGVLIAATVIDVRTGKVPNVLTLPAIAAGFAWAAIWGAIDPDVTVAGKLGECFFAFALAMVVFGFIRFAGALGGGDVKLMIAVGAVSASAAVVFNTIVYSMVALIVISLFVMIRHGVIRQTTRNLVTATMMAGAGVKPELDDSRKIPFAVAVAIGGIMAGAETLLGVAYPWSVYGLGAATGGA